MLPVTKRDFAVRKLAVAFMVTQYRQGKTQNNENNLARFFANRHNYVYDDKSGIPRPIRRF